MEEKYKITSWKKLYVGRNWIFISKRVQKSASQSNKKLRFSLCWLDYIVQSRNIFCIYITSRICINIWHSKGGKNLNNQDLLRCKRKRSRLTYRDIREYFCIFLMVISIFMQRITPTCPPKKTRLAAGPQPDAKCKQIQTQLPNLAKFNFRPVSQQIRSQCTNSLISLKPRTALQKTPFMRLPN